MFIFLLIFPVLKRLGQMVNHFTFKLKSKMLWHYGLYFHLKTAKPMRLLYWDLKISKQINFHHARYLANGVVYT